MQTQPITSRLANEASKPHRDTNYRTILHAMRKLKNQKGIADNIAAYCTLDKTEVSRRLGEMAHPNKNLVYDTGRKGITAKGCKAIIWRIREEEKETEQLLMFQ